MPDHCADTGAIVRLSGVGVDADRVAVLRDLDMTVARGECVGVMGPNGSGKSTLLRALATLLRPVAGHGQVLGARLGTAECRAVRPLIGLVGHTPALYPQLTLRENLGLVARLTDRSLPAVDEVLAMVGLAGAADRRAEVCSAGMRRRAELARLLFAVPRLALLDEPHAGLDTASAPLVAEVVGRVRDAGGACVVVSHDRARLAGLAGRIVELGDGRIRRSEPEVVS